MNGTEGKKGWLLGICLVEIVFMEDEKGNGVVVGLWGGGNIEDGAEEAGKGCFAGGRRAGETDYEILGCRWAVSRHFGLWVGRMTRSHSEAR